MIRKFGLYAIWVLASLAMAGSLYLHELLGLEPCPLCWYQRICLFPLAIITGFASWHGFFSIATYLLPQVIVGLGFALYQLLITQMPGWSFLAPGHPCMDPPYIPFLAAAIFFVITLLLIAVSRQKNKKEPL